MHHVSALPLSGLQMCIRDRVWNAFQDEKKLDDVKLEKESGRALRHVVTETGDCYRYEADVTFAEGTRGFSVGVRAQEADDEFYSFSSFTSSSFFSSLNAFHTVSGIRHPKVPSFL